MSKDSGQDDEKAKRGSGLTVGGECSKGMRVESGFLES